MDASDPLRDMAPVKRERIATQYRAVQRWKFALLGFALLERPPARR